MGGKQLLSSQKVLTSPRTCLVDKFDFSGTLFFKGFRLIASGLFLWLLVTQSPQAAVAGEKGVAKLKELYLKTVLAENGQPKAVIVLPKEKGYQHLGKLIQERIRRVSGALVPMVTEISQAQGNIIALGKMTNNKIIERLYWNHYTLVDSVYPGKEGYIIQTVHNPYPLPEGTNVIILGGSDLRGVERAVEHFLRLVPLRHKIALDRLFIVVPESKLTEEQRAKMLESEYETSFYNFNIQAAQYLRTGDEIYAKIAKKILYQLLDEYAKEPKRRLTWPEETTSMRIFYLWDAIEESPSFSQEDRRKITELLLKVLHNMPQHIYEYASLERNETVLWNHITFPLLGLYYGSRYFKRYYGNVDGMMDLYLSKVKGAFGGQMKSWKPREDSAGYVVLTPLHTIDYTLAEGDLSWFENGSVQQLADYCIACCDNQGIFSGFGDYEGMSGSGGADQIVAYAFWWTKDGRYLWALDKLTGGKWANPYWTDIKPTEPKDLLGVTLMPMSKEVYRYYGTRSAYDEPFVPTKVPYEKTFDKISFRDTWDTFGQYLLLDGFSRGHHLHYDGNAIVRFAQGGKVWLLDNDYLVRNTTEHCMVSVVRDGRSDQLIPTYASLDRLVELKNTAYTQTSISDYNGVDWQRTIIWTKGDYFVVLDRLKARKEGQYTFDCVWKVLDLGQERIINEKTFQVFRSGERWLGTDYFKLIFDETASGGKAVQFKTSGSVLEFQLPLDKGEYSLNLHGKGLDTGSDSFWVYIDGEKQPAFHIPVGKFGPSSSSWQKDSPTPEVMIKESGTHKFRVELRESAGAMLDKVVFRPKENPEKVKTIEAEDLLKGKLKEVVIPDQYFNIINANLPAAALSSQVGEAKLKISARESASSHLRSKKLHQILRRRMGVGSEEYYHNLLCVVPKGSQVPDLTRIDTYTSAITGLRTALVGLGMESRAKKFRELEIQAALFNITPSAFSLVDAKSLGLRSQIFYSQQPVSIEFDLERGIGIIIASQRTRVTLLCPIDKGEVAVDGRRVQGIHGVKKISFEVPKGKHSVIISPWQPDKVLRESIRKEIESLKEKSEKIKEPTVPPEEPIQQNLEVIWKFQAPELVLEGQPSPLKDIYTIFTADLDNDGRLEILAGVNQEAICFSYENKELWRFGTNGAVKAIHSADIDGDGKKEVLVGSNDQTLYVLDNRGNLLWKQEMTVKLISGAGGEARPLVNTILVEDLEADGNPEIIVGTMNCYVIVYDKTGKMLWERNQVYHGARYLKAMDLDGDEKKEILVANRYGAVHIFKHNGTPLPGSYSELGDVVYEAADIDGDGKIELVNGSSTGALTCTEYSGKLKWRFDNFGFAVKEIEIADLEGDGSFEVLIVSETGYIYVLNPKGEIIWRKDLSDVVNSVTAVDLTGDGRKEVIIGSDDEYIRVFNYKGEEMGFLKTAGRVLKVGSSDFNGDKTPEIIGVSEGGYLYVLRLSALPCPPRQAGLKICS